ncbi:uncharacterized protein LOC132185482 [Corylus avellana]|uniref:uncharacterized protein LOC132185482 n=1 Tax=Corylus avellana TaxID=13451 RepID=UPI00286CE5AA|nr:uncharacterized protein LOC132185482 [Corylus avellana]
MLGLLKMLWNDWGIEILVLASSGKEIKYTDQQNVPRELEALLAPLLLVQLGNPDTITAYSIEDNRLGLRQLLILIFQVGIVVYILIRYWTTLSNTTTLSFVYLPMFLAGIIKYGELAWALKSALKNFGLTIEEIDKQENVSPLFLELPRDIPGLELISKAYYRFDCLKPHLENWFYKPFHECLPWMLIDAYLAEDMFKIIDAELGFMYDVLYTKAPIIYTRKGCILRIISFFSIVFTLCGFTVLFKKCLHHRNWEVVYTFVVLIITIILEVYQIILLPFSDWAIIQMIKHHNMPIMLQCLRVLGSWSCRRKKWSNSLGQFNLLSFCLHDKQLKFSRIIKFRGLDIEFRKSCNRKRVELPIVLKEVIVQELKEVDQVRDPKAITQRGQWALERHGCLNQFRWSVKRNFDKSITIWHIATYICYDSDIILYDTINSHVETSKLLSNYMMYLLALRRHMLCTTAADVIFHHAYTKLMKFLRTGPSIIRDEHKACGILGSDQGLLEESNSDRSEESIITSNWHVLQDAQRLSRSLMEKENMWHIISSVWVEMLCYAASNCPMNFHAEQLRRGGGLITHVWLLLAHKTERFYTSD